MRSTVERAAILSGLIWLASCALLSAKLGEDVPQLVERFGKKYTAKELEAAELYTFSLTKFTVVVVVKEGHSVCETYYSRTSLTKTGTPPSSIVNGVLRTNVPNAKWQEIIAEPFRGEPWKADFAWRTPDYGYIATISYLSPQPYGASWSVTVANSRPVTAPIPPPTPPPPVTTPAPTIVESDSARVLIRNCDLASVRALLIEFCRRRGGNVTDTGENFVTYSDQIMTETGDKARFYETFSLFPVDSGVRVLGRVKGQATDSRGQIVQFPLNGAWLDKMQEVLSSLKAAVENPKPLPTPPQSLPSGA